MKRKKGRKRKQRGAGETGVLGKNTESKGHSEEKKPLSVGGHKVSDGRGRLMAVQKTHQKMGREDLDIALASLRKARGLEMGMTYREAHQRDPK